MIVDMNMGMMLVAVAVAMAMIYIAAALRRNSFLSNPSNSINWRWNERTVQEQESDNIQEKADAPQN